MNNEKVKKLCGILFFAIVIIVLGNNYAFAGTTEAAYKKYMKNIPTYIKVEYIDGYDYDRSFKGNWKTGRKLISTKYFKKSVITDINGDKKKELLLSDTVDGNGTGHYVVIFTYKGGKVVPVFCVTGLRNGIWRAKNNQICFRFGGSDTFNGVFLKLEGKKLKRKESIWKLRNNDYSYSFYKNKKKISEKKYYLLLERQTSQIRFK